jgi:hypothetical protein
MYVCMKLPSQIYLENLTCHPRQTSLHRGSDMSSEFANTIFHSNNNIPPFNGFLTISAFIHMFTMSAYLEA